MNPRKASQRGAREIFISGEVFSLVSGVIDVASQEELVFYQFLF